MGSRLAWILALGMSGSAVAAQEAPPASQESEEAPATAEKAQVERLLGEHQDAAEDGDGQAVVKLLGEMAAFDNREFIGPAKDGLLYKPSKSDRTWAQAEADELGLKQKDELEEILLTRVCAVQAAATRVLANHPGDKKVAGALAKAFKDKEVRKHRPVSLAAIILALGEVEQRRVEGEVFSEFKSATHTEVARACVRYFGLIRSRDMSVVRRLCNELSAPEPASVNSASNPPAAYWELRWKIWNAIRRDVSWSLQQITGQVFKPSEGEHPSDERKALEYIKEHKKELGLK